jgi:predicted secreted hydrolase
LRVKRSSAWGTDQVFLAHFALSDIADDDFQALERYSRGSAGLAGSETNPFKVWLYDWRVEQVGETTYLVHARQGDLFINLHLEDTKGPILHGYLGYSQKGADSGNASTYVSLTRLQTTGLVGINGESFEVTGSSWMDHEYSTNALSPNQIGWDWFAIQLDDLTELMVYTIRRSDGTVDPFSSGTFINQGGSTTSLKVDEFSISVLDTWESPHSNAVYPSKWLLIVESLNLVLEINPLIPDQELNLSYVYWEGAVVIRGEVGGKPIKGVGYVELTGYQGPFAGDF